MAPRQVATRGGKPKSTARSVYDEVTNPANRTVLTAVGVFAVGVAFFHSSLSEFLVPV